MKEGKIFLVGNAGGELIPMVETTYEAEEVLQALLVQYPDLLPGDQITPEAPRRWLLVAREMGVPGAEHETGRWSLDHLFLDQDGIPTFVECKRSSDTRGRREVVAQMLDYAANGIQYWGMDRLRQAAAETAERRGKALDEEVLALLEDEETGAEEDVESFWSLVEVNLKKGRVRLIFVGDDTPPELRRLVEFLNEKMADVEVLAVEVKQYVGRGQQALAARVIGATESARIQKGGRAPRMTRGAFMSQVSANVAPLFEEVLDRAGERGYTIRWGTTGFAVRVYLEANETLASFFYGFPTGILQFYFGHFPFEEDEELALRQQLMDFGIFAPSGEKTLTAKVEQAPRERVLAMVNFVLERMAEIGRRY